MVNIHFIFRLPISFLLRGNLADSYCKIISIGKIISLHQTFDTFTIVNEFSQKKIKCWIFEILYLAIRYYYFLKIQKHVARVFQNIPAFVQ